jgi:hypothetical protein
MTLEATGLHSNIVTSGFHANTWWMHLDQDWLAQKIGAADVAYEKERYADSPNSE